MVRCANCGLALPERSRFCPECGVRIGAIDDETALAEVPPNETGRVPFDSPASELRFFGITPPMAVLALAAAALALAILLLVSGHLIAAIILFVAAALFSALFVQSARRLPDVAIARASAHAFADVRARAGSVVDALAAHSSAQVELFRLRRELGDLVAQRAEAARTLGEAVYGGDDDAAEESRNWMRELDELLAAKEAEMGQVAALASERIQRAQFQVQPTAVIEPPGIPEPYPVPSEPPQPVIVPEPGPVPSEPTPIPAPFPEPTAPPETH